MASQKCVLIVDRFAESREVLRTALDKGGAQVLETARTDFGLALARSNGPDVIVLDLEVVENPAKVVADFAAAAKASGGRLIVLGGAQHSQHELPCEFFAKPYHYRPLVLRIEELLHAECGRAAA